MAELIEANYGVLDEHDKSPERQAVTMKETAVPVSTVSNETAIAYCMAGLLALGVGWFAAGILCGLVAVYLGRKAVEHGARTFGRLVQWGGWAELILTIIGLALMPMG